VHAPTRPYATAAALATVALFAACGRLGYDSVGEILDSDAGVGDPERMASIAAGDCHTCAISGGAIYCWGCNQAGQLGLDDVEPRATPVRLLTMPGFDRIWVGKSHSCALRGGFLWCWGDDTFGQLGLGNLGGFGSSPVRLPGNSWSDATLGYTHTCGVTGSGDLSCWGDNGGAQLGLGVEGGDHPDPEPVAGSGWGSGRGARDTTCFLQEGGSLWCWGLPLFDRAPVAVDTAVYRRVDVGGDSICRVTDEGALVCSCADASAGCSQLDWRQVGDATDWIVTSSGLSHTCGLREGGSLWCWGENADGQLGFGSTLGVPEPIRVGVSAWLAVSAGAHHTCAVRGDQTTWCWGRNDSGQLGQGATSEPVLEPVPVVFP